MKDCSSGEIKKLKQQIENKINNDKIIEKYKKTNEELKEIINKIKKNIDFKNDEKEKILSIEEVINIIYIIVIIYILQKISQLKIILNENEICIFENYEKLLNNKFIDELLIFWNDIIRKNKNKFSSHQNINTIINNIEEIIKKIENKQKKRKSSIIFEDDEKKMGGLHNSFEFFRKKDSDKLLDNNLIFTTPTSTKNLLTTKFESSTKIISPEIEDDNDENEKGKKVINRINTISNNEFTFREEDFKNERKGFFRFTSKKSATIGGNLQKLNNLEIKFFNYQEEQNENNYIAKKKQSKNFLNFIDIDLFLQYIALGKKFYDNEEENNNLIEGFCLQYQTFIFAETLINKIISCFNYFYSKYINTDNVIIEEAIEKDENKTDNDNDIIDKEEKEKEKEEEKEKGKEKEEQNNISDHVFKTNLEYCEKKIPYGLIDFLHIFIKIHNFYYHNELSKETINKINNFLTRLIDIKEINENYQKIIELSEIELKEYEASIKKFEPIIQKKEQREMDLLNSSSDEFNSEEEKGKLREKDVKIKKEGKEKEKVKKEKEKEKEKEDEEKGEKVKKEIKEEEKKEIKEEIKENEEKGQKEKEEKKEDKNKDKESIKKENEENAENKGKEIEKEDIKKKFIFNDSQTLKIKSSKDILPISFTKIYQDDFSTKSLNIVKKTKENNIEEEKDKEKEEKIGKGKPYEFDIIKYKTQDIASELARVNYSLFSKIKVKEFLKGSFNKKDKYKLSPNICKIIKRFNTLSSWVIEEILSYDHAEKRAQIVLKFIRICVVLKKIGDFDDCLSIISGLNNYIINKLDKTWGHIPSNDMSNFRGLKKMLSFEDNWKILRYEIEKKIKEKSFFIPYLGYYTKRLLYLEELGPYIKKNTSLINIEKIVEIYKTLKSFYQIKNINNCGYNCQDKKIKKELLVLQCLESSNEDFLVQISNVLEPKFILSTKKLKIKRRTKTDICFLNNINKINNLL